MLGIIAARVGNLDAAVELYGRALAVNGRSAECHFNIGAGAARAGPQPRGHRASRRGNGAQARLCCRAYRARRHAGAQNELDRRARSYEQVLAIDPRLVDARHGLANVLRQQGRLDEAAEQFRQVVALKPDYAEAHSNLGVVLAAQGRWAEAAEHISARCRSSRSWSTSIAISPAPCWPTAAPDEALAAIMRGLAVRRDRRSQGDIRAMRTVGDELPPDERISRLVARALTEGWGRSAELSPLAVLLFMSSETGRVAIEPMLSAPDELATRARLLAICPTIVCCARCWNRRRSAMPRLSNS